MLHLTYCRRNGNQTWTKQKDSFSDIYKITLDTSDHLIDSDAFFPIFFVAILTHMPDVVYVIQTEYAAKICFVFELLRFAHGYMFIHSLNRFA